MPPVHRASPLGSKIRQQAEPFNPEVGIWSPKTNTESPLQDKEDGPFPGNRRWVSVRLPVGLVLRDQPTRTGNGPRLNFLWVCGPTENGPRLNFWRALVI